MWELREKYEWRVVPWPDARWRRSARRQRPGLGGVLTVARRILGQTVDTLRLVDSGSVLYAADQQSGSLLGWLRRLRLVHTPLIVFVHNGPREPRLSGWLKGAGTRC